MQTQQIPRTQPPQEDKPRRTGPLIAAAAFVLVLIAGAAVLLSSRAVSEPPSETVAADLAPESIPTPSEAIAVANSWYGAFNAGDVDAAIALFAPDAAVGSNWGISTLEKERLNNTWNAAQGTRLETDGCAPAGESPDGNQQRIRCTGANHDALVQAVDATPVSAMVTMSIGADGIAALSYTYGPPDFNHVADPFEAWMDVHHPAVEDFGFGSYKTVAEAEAAGTLRAQYAAEWATYLEANDCTYLDGC